MTVSAKNIAVIGAGYAGMSAAFDLVRAGHRVTLFEQNAQCGGLASGFKESQWDWSVEHFYHHFFQSDHQLLKIIDELGLSDLVFFRKPISVMYDRGKFYPFDSIPAALAYPGLGFGINKIRFGLVGLYLKLGGNWRKLEKETTDAWMRKWAGDFAYESMWQPMMIGKFGENWHDKVNMAWMWARLHSRTTQLGGFKGGFQNFADRFAERLNELGVNLYLNSAVKSLQQLPSGRWELHGEGIESAEYDQVLVTLSPRAMTELAPQLPDAWKQQLLSLKSIGAVVMTISLKHALSPEGYYWYNIPKQAGYPFLSLVEHTNFISEEHFGGEHILYIGDYLETDHPNFSKSQEELLAEFLPHLRKINPAFTEDWVNKAWLYRAAYAQPIPLVNHSGNIPSIKTPLEGLYFASMSQVYPFDRGTNYAVELGRRVASLMASGAVAHVQ